MTNTPTLTNEQLVEIEGRSPVKEHYVSISDYDGIVCLTQTERDALIATIRSLQAREAELERRLRIPFGKLGCAQCGGPHDFDTSVPSVVWNAVIRAKGLPDYLCTTCIVREFVGANQGFTATLWNEELSGVPIEIVVNGQNANDAALIQEENNTLRNKLARILAAVQAKGEEWQRQADAARLGTYEDERYPLLHQADAARELSEVIGGIE